ncbi:NUDIX hydrolase [Aestuariirhabdus sp. Z084]|uniref:NUDIX hydrolase n=1 Tax=Aestuariirhabdus haliotis TaxID=2918751 RepID=UPI00201B389B|nr:NUDIX hydrolase [Aestuariirhabdus haliotis]MCL6414893.1 NUDIX hydrolase [Aestuariirhabdus haliotis]MCL6418825.1 NUDIX hydrolase [Aestuariirhabdus haliotis]
MEWPPHITVAAIIEDDGKFLFVEEEDQGKPVINQPAGHLEPGETFIEATLREVLEETCWEVSIEFLVGIYVYESPHNQTIYHRYCYCGHPVRHRTDAVRDTDITGVHWLSFDSLLQPDRRLRSPLVKRCLDDYLNGTCYPLALIKEHG